jgi:DNA repair exonuclease SbcCD nuclease subunit
MLRLLHTADVHLGARYADLGDRAAAQRERQFAAFHAAVDLALAEPVDVVLIAGDLFDSNVQPRRSVERVAAELHRLVEGRIRTIVIPGTHDVYDRASIYRAHDLAALAGSQAGEDLVTVLTPERPTVRFEGLDLEVHGLVFATKRAPRSPLEGFQVEREDGARWQVALLHGSVAIPGKTDGDEVVVTPEEIAASGLDYLALGHWHSTQRGRAGVTTWAYPGAPEPVALDQDRAGNVLLVQLEETSDGRQVTIEERKVGRTRFERIEIDAATVESQPALIASLTRRADPDLVVDLRLGGVRPDELDLMTEEVEAALAPSFLKVRVRDRSHPALTEGPLPSADTIAGAFIRDLEARILAQEAAGDETGAAELRDALRLGRLLLAGHEVTL